MIDDPKACKRKPWIYGKSNTYKTFFSDIIFKQYSINNQIFRPRIKDDRFSFDDFEEDHHLIILFDEMELQNFDFSLWKQITCNGTTTTSVKYKSGSKVVNTSNTITIHFTNTDLEETVQKNKNKISKDNWVAFYNRIIPIKTTDNIPTKIREPLFESLEIGLEREKRNKDKYKNCNYHLENGIITNKN